MRITASTLAVFGILLALPLGGCGSLFAQKHAGHARAAKTQNAFDAPAYTGHLALAKLSAGQEDTIDLDAIEAASTLKKTKSTRQTLLVLEYKTPDTKRTHRLAAPLTPDNTELMVVMNALSDSSYTLQDIHVTSAVVSPPAPVNFDAMTPEQTVAWVDAQEQRLIENGHRPAPLDAAPQQLKLLRFFIAHNLRDPAYLMAGNAKQSLALATQAKGNDEAIRKMSQELDGLEAQLHQEMPFTL